MHIDWRWLKQRPQFLAEAFESLGVATSAFYVPSRRRTDLRDSPSGLNRTALPLIPRWGSRTAYGLNRLLSASFRRRLQPGVLWITHPGLASVVPNGLSDHVLVYDCMDDHAAMEATASGKKFLRDIERMVVHNARLVVCSSELLLDHVTRRLGRDRASCMLLPNGLAFDDRWLQPPPPPPPPLNALFFGTIGDWLDFPSLITALDEIPDLHITMVGPIRAPIRSHAQLSFLPPIPHSELHTLARVAHCFLLPFAVSETVSAVDPVKLYEYIAMNRPIIARDYPGIDRFKPFIAVYDSRDGLIAHLDRLRRSWQRPPTALSETAEAFLRHNTWSERARQVIEHLHLI